MTRWFPIAPGTTLGPAPAAVGGQITATKTVPVWNETVLLSARSRTTLAVASLPYPLQLLNEVDLTAHTRVEAARALPSALIQLAPVAPLVSTGASVSAPALDQLLAANSPAISGGASAVVPAINTAVVALDPESAGLPRTVVQIPVHSTAYNTASPVVATGASISMPAVDLATAPNAPTVAYIDPSFSSVSLLLQMDGTNGSTIFTDSSSKALSVSAFGNAQLSTSVKKHGTASGVFDGSGDYLSVAYNSAIDLNSSDFTIEAWVYPTAGNANGARFLSAGGGAVAYNSTNGIHTLFQLTGASSMYIDFQWWNGTGASSITSVQTLSLNTWTHIAVCRSGSTIYTAVGGVVEAFTGKTFGRPSANPSLAIATIPGEAGSSSNAWKGYLDSLRITKGVARYTSNFTPPPAAFPS